MIALLLAIVQDPAAATPLLLRAAERLAAEQRCVIDPASTDITVCGLRSADRFRVPFDLHDDGDPRHESVAAERVRLLNRRSPLQDMGPFQVGGGMAGVTVKAGADGVTTSGLRKPAP